MKAGRDSREEGFGRIQANKDIQVQGRHDDAVQLRMPKRAGLAGVGVKRGRPLGARRTAAGTGYKLPIDCCTGAAQMNLTSCCG